MNSGILTSDFLKVEISLFPISDSKEEKTSFLGQILSPGVKRLNSNSDLTDYSKLLNPCSSAKSQISLSSSMAKSTPLFSPQR